LPADGAWRILVMRIGNRREAYRKQSGSASETFNPLNSKLKMTPTLFLPRSEQN
jgi:hypothetical protein